MKAVNKIELKLENFEKCFALLDADCPLGQIYDYTCVLQSFIIQKMKDYESKREESIQSPETAKE